MMSGNTAPSARLMALVRQQNAEQQQSTRETIGAARSTLTRARERIAQSRMRLRELDASRDQRRVLDDSADAAD